MKPRERAEKLLADWEADPNTKDAPVSVFLMHLASGIEMAIQEEREAIRLLMVEANAWPEFECEHGFHYDRCTNTVCAVRDLRNRLDPGPTKGDGT